MAKIDTLTAYKCKFSYLQRNNPLLEEQRDAIKEGKQPDFTFSDFIIKYVETVKNMVVGTNTDRAIILENTDVSEGLMKGVKTWHIIPRAGKQGKPVTVIKKNTGKKYDFGSDTAALYAYHIFCYENEDGMYMIFHRQNGSGYKQVLIGVAALIIFVSLFCNRKVNLISVLKKQIKVLKNDRKGKTSFWDICCFILFPILLAMILSIGLDCIITDAVATTLTTIFAFIFTVLFGFAAILVDKLDSERKIEKRVVAETFVSIISSTVLSLFSAIVSVVIIVVENENAVCILSLLVYGASFINIMLLLLIIKRTFLIYCDNFEE